MGTSERDVDEAMAQIDSQLSVDTADGCDLSWEKRLHSFSFSECARASRAGFLFL